jgi:hypothetical protein
MLTGLFFCGGVAILDKPGKSIQRFIERVRNSGTRV